MKKVILKMMTLAVLVSSAKSYGLTPRPKACGSLSGTRYSVTQINMEPFYVLIKGDDEDSEFTIKIVFNYELGNKTESVQKFGHSFQYQPFVFDSDTHKSQPSILILDGQPLSCD